MDGIGSVRLFLKSNSDRFAFDWLRAEERQGLLSTIAAVLDAAASGSAASAEDRLTCVQALRLLSRDKACCAAIAATDGRAEGPPQQQLMALLLAASGLSEYTQSRGDVVAIQERTDVQVQIEALKSMCNLVFNSEGAQSFCCKNDVANAIVQRSKTYEVAGVDYQIKLFDMRLLFILTALCTEVRQTVCVDLKGLCYLPDVLETVLNGSKIPAPLNDASVELAVQVLKALYNVTIGLSSPGSASDGSTDLHIHRLARLLRHLLAVKTQSEDRRMELSNHVVNLMINISPALYDEFLQPLPGSAGDTHVGKLPAKAGGVCTDVVDSILMFLHKKLNTDNADGSLPSLIPAIAVLTTFARGSPLIRKYCRMKVLPYLKDEVKQLPQEGDTLRNRLCVLLTVPNSDVSGAAAEFLYVLCNENVERLIKYSGFGNAAGLLAQRGLMAGSQTKRGSTTSGHSSTSEDSETDEYKELEPDVNPVTGRWEPVVPGSNPVDNMTEEQKEYEAVKLIELMHKLTEQKVIQPATVGADGHPKAVEHVLELIASMPRVSDNSDDSD